MRLDEIMNPPVQYPTLPDETDMFDLLRQKDEEGNGFEVLHHDPEQHSPLRPLVILVHPGDMIETGDGWDDRNEYDKVREFSVDNQVGTAEDIAAWRQKYQADVIVLHRGSCSQFDGDGESDLCDQIEMIWQNGSILHGDNLEDAANWMIQHLHIAERPRVYLAGAYSCPKYGCLTSIGKAIEKVIGPKRITVSGWSPPGNSPGKVWRPGNRSVPFWKANAEPHGE